MKQLFLRRFKVVASIITTVFLVAVPSPAFAVLQEKVLTNVGNAQVLAVNPDGTNPVDLGVGFWPDVSPDGKKMVTQHYTTPCYEGRLTTSFGIFIHDVGSPDRTLIYTEHCEYAAAPRWSPDGTKIAYYRGHRTNATTGPSDIYTMNPDGTDQQLVIANAKWPAWSPDGTKIAFQTNDQQLGIANSDGTNLVVFPDINAHVPLWSPDGTRIVFTWEGVYTINADGTNRLKVFDDWSYIRPLWSPDSSVILIPEGGDTWWKVNADGSGVPVLVSHVGGYTTFWGLVDLPSAPVVNGLPPASLMLGDAYMASGSFTDPDSTNWTATVDYGDGTGTQPLSLADTTFALNHIYEGLGTFTVTVAVTDDQGLTGTTSTEVTVQRQLTAAGPVRAWVGPASITNVGLRFDLLAEVFVNGMLVTSGQVNSQPIGFGFGGFNVAQLREVVLAGFSPVDLPPSSSLEVKLSARNACSGSLRNSGTIRLWFNDAQANSNVGATIGGQQQDYFLHANALLGLGTGAGPMQSIDVPVGAKCSEFKSFGTWQHTQ